MSDNKEYRTMHKLFFAVSVFLFVMQSAIAADPQTIAQAIEQVKQISDPNPVTQDRMRAAEAQKIVHDRLLTTNDASGLVLNTLPVDFWNDFNGEGKTKTRDEFIEYARNQPGWNIVQAAWDAKAGRCNEHAAIVATILKGAGVDVSVLESDRAGGHAFPVVDLPPGADPDIPWTWGKNWVVADSWNGKTSTAPQDLWNDDMYFGRGGHHVWSDKSKIPTRDKIARMLAKGPDFVQAHCEEYNALVAKLNVMPPGSRLVNGFNPPKDCHDFKKTQYMRTLIGTWQTAWGELQVTGTPGGGISGSYTYKINDGSTAQGFLKGKEDDGIFAGTWSERGADKQAGGTVTLTVSEDGRNFSGPWKRMSGTTAVDSGTWTGKRAFGPRAESK